MDGRVKPVWCCFHQEYYIVRNYILYSGLACKSLAEKYAVSSRAKTRAKARGLCSTISKESSTVQSSGTTFRVH